VKVVVAGAGISGLAIGRELRRRGMEVSVLEADARAGGKVRSERIQGFLCEDGPGSYLEDAESRALLDAAGLSDCMVKASTGARRRYLCVGGRLMRAPESPPTFFKSEVVGFLSKLRVFGDVFLPRGPAGRGEEESVRAFARRRVGRRVADRMVAAVVSGIYAGDPDQISVLSAFPRMAEMEREHRSLILAALRAGRRGGPRGREIASFSGGMQQATDALAHELFDALRPRVALRRVDAAGRGFTLAVEQDGSVGEIGADAVVLAIPAPDAAAVTGRLDAPAADALLAIPYAAVAVLHLGFAREDVSHPLDGFGFLVPPGEGRPLLGALFSSSLFHGRAPDGSVLVTALCGGAMRPDVIALPDGALVESVLDDLRAVLGIRAAPRFSRVVRHARAIPQYTLHHRERVAAVEAAQARHAGLFFAGNAYRGVAFTDCLRNAGPLCDRIVALAR